VDPDEQALVRRFGEVTDVAGPGLHWHLPAPIAKHDTVKVTQVQRMEVGFRSLESGITTTNPVEALMITGDENIVDVEMVVLYRISSIRDFVLNVRDPGEVDRGIGDRPDGRTLKDVAEVSLRGVIGQRPIDDVLTAERGIIEQEVKDTMVKLLSLYKTGILVEQVQLQTVRAPDQVQAAFDDVVSAKEDKERLDNEAQAYAADIVPRAEGNAERIVNEAKAFEAERINEAQGRAAEFLAILEEYAKAPDVTRERLYLEAMERILPDVRKFVIDSETGSPLQFLPLTGFQGEGGVQ
jgi:membrane protease subunit HflK